jgi:hypothetical protein
VVEMAVAGGGLLTGSIGIVERAVTLLERLGLGVVRERVIMRFHGQDARLGRSVCLSRKVQRPRRGCREWVTYHSIHFGVPMRRSKAWRMGLSRCGRIVGSLHTPATNQADRRGMMAF